MKLYRYILAAATAIALTGCADDPETPGSEDEKPGGNEGVVDGVVGFYLLNEGNMGANKCTLDYYDYATAT